MFIQTESTPNPSTLKLIPGRVVLSEGTAEFDGTTLGRSALADGLLGIHGVSRVFFTTDYLTVTKADDQDWVLLKPAVLAAVMDYFLTHDRVTVVPENGGGDIPQSSGQDDPIANEIRDLLDARIRPAVAMDGGDITFDRFEDGIVYVRLQGACSGCPSSTMTLKDGIESMLKHYIPEVLEVRPVA